MKRKWFQKALCLSAATMLVFGLAACGNKENTPSSNTTATKAPTAAPAADAGKATEAPVAVVPEIEKPAEITIMVNGTLLDQASGRQQFEEKFAELDGVKLKVIQPDHNTYNDQVALAFTSGMQADALILSSDKYTSYAANGALWDMTEAWENSEAKASGIVGNQYIDALKIDGKLYGFAPARGNGCITYIRKDWLDNLGLAVPTTYDEYIEVLRAFTEDDPDGNGVKDTFGVSAAGIYSKEAPYTNYLPEFWQDAIPDFTQLDNGTWVDGFSEANMSAALTRLKDAYSKGYIDIEVVSNTTSACRDKFYAGNYGVFTYWAGKWNVTLEQNLQNTFPTASLVGMEPIAELGDYLERQPPVWAITSSSKNPEGVFKYLLETMVDGGAGQMLWTYGAEGTHYEVKDGTYTQLPDPEVPTSTFLSAHIDPVLSIVNWEDPLASARDARIEASNKSFVENSVVAPLVVQTESMGNYAATLNDIRQVIVSEVVTGSTSVEDGMAKYKEQSASMVAEILAELNK